jgi:hypothetical protein
MVLRLAAAVVVMSIVCRMGWSEGTAPESPVVVKPPEQKADKAKTDGAMELGGTLSGTTANLSHAAGVNIIIDPEVADRVIPSLRVHNMPLRHALNWICRLTGTAWMLRDEAIFITTPEKAGTSSVDLKVYDVRDITTAVPDFAGPEFIIGADSAGGMAVSMTADTVQASSVIPIEDLIQVIMGSVQTAGGEGMPAPMAKASTAPSAAMEVWGYKASGDSVKTITLTARSAPDKQTLTAAELAEFMKASGLEDKDKTRYVVQRSGPKGSVKADVLLGDVQAEKYKLVASMPQKDGKNLLIFVAEEAKSEKGK